MKRRSLDPEVATEAVEHSLYEALLSLRNVEEMAAFLRDLCTPAELEVMVDRWRVVPYLLEGVAYREIHERTAVSITTIGRVARYLNQGSGGYLAAAARAARRRAPAKAKAAARKARA
jgi:TrpR-related protein YerC/YecD